MIDRLLEGVSRPALVLLALLLAALVAAPWFANDYLITTLILILYFAYAGQAWNVMMGFAGQLSLGHAIYVGLGAYTLFALAIAFGISPLWAIPLAGAIAAGVAIPVALLVFRLRGHYFAIGTWIVAEVFRLTASQISALGGGSGTRDGSD